MLLNVKTWAELFVLFVPFVNKYRKWMFCLGVVLPARRQKHTKQHFLNSYLFVYFPKWPFLCLHRFEKGRIYSYIGEVVVSVNPYRAMNIYGRDTIEQYKGRELYERPPHLFAIADAAYKAMKRRNKDTCIVISGNSESPPFVGRTKSTKAVFTTHFKFWIIFQVMYI